MTLSNGERICLSRHSESFADYITMEAMDVNGISATFTGKITINPSDLVFAQVILYYSKISEGERFNIHDAEWVTTTQFIYDNQFSITLSDLKFDSDYRYCVALKLRSKEIYSSIEEFKVYDTNLLEYTILPEYQFSNTWCKTGIYASDGGAPAILVTKFTYDVPESDPLRPKNWGKCIQQYMIGSFGGFFSGVDPSTHTLCNNKTTGKYELVIGHTYFIKTVINRDQTITTYLYDGDDEDMSDPLDRISRSGGDIECEIWVGNYHIKSEDARSYSAYHGLRLNTFEIRTSDNSLLLSALPVKRNSDNTHGVYDLVSRRFIPESDEL